MSDNIYDILGKLKGLAPKENPQSTAEPIYESVDPRGDIMSAVAQLEERYIGFKEAKAKRKEPEAVVPASDLTRSADPDVARLATKAKFIKPELNDFEAIVSYTSKLEKELEQAEKADVVDRQKIEQTQQMLAKTQANQDSMQKVITATDQRFRALNDKVASGQITAQDQAAAQAAQQIEKDHDAAVASIPQQANQPTASAQQQPSANIYQFPDKEQPAAQTTTGQQNLPTGVASMDTARTRKAGQQRTRTTGDPLMTATPLQRMAAESKESKLKMLREYKEGDPNLGLINYNSALKAFQNAQEKITLDFGGKPLTLYDYQLYGLLTDLTADQNQDRKLARAEAVMSNYDSVVQLLMTPKVKKLIQKFPEYAKKNPRFKTRMRDVNRGQFKLEPAPSVDPRYDPRLDPNSPEFDQAYAATQSHPYQRSDSQLEENSGNPSMKNLEQLAESLMEKYMGFDKTVAAIKKGGSAENPEAVAAAIGRKKYGKAKFQKAAAAGKKLGEDAKPDFLDLDKDGDTEEPMKSAAKSAKDEEPAKPDSDAVAKRKRLQALKDKQEDERAEKDDYDSKSSTRVVKGRAYGGAAQKDDEEKDLDESGLQAYLGKKKYGKEGMKALQKAGREGASKEKMAMLRAKHDKMDEVAPPGAKAERMVKHIKKGYSKDGKLTPKEKGIAYATAWKAHNKGQVEEGVSFGDTIKNSKAELKKHKMVKEGRNPESSEYTYETVGRILSDEQPGLDCNSEAFVKAVYDELIEMKMTPKAARWLVHYDEDFISDCASSYSHFCDSKEKEMAECGAPMNAFVSEEPMVDAVQELDEIARLAGLTRENYNPMVPGDSASPLTYAGCSKCNADPCCCEDEKAMDEGMGCSEDELNEAATRKDFRMVADLLKSIPDMAKRTELAMYHADIFKQQNSRFKKEMFLAAAGVDTTPIKDESVETEGNAFTGKLADTPKGGEFELDGKKFKDTSSLEEEEMGEGNEFSGALAKAKAAGEKEFEVDGKKYTVKEDINMNVSANGEEDVVNLIRKLSGMPVVAIQAQPAMAEEVVAEEGPKERDIEYTNTPREEVAGTDAAIPAGGDLNRAKKQYKKEYPGDNPMAVAEAKEEQLWKAYETMINDVKA